MCQSYRKIIIVNISHNIYKITNQSSRYPQPLWDVLSIFFSFHLLFYIEGGDNLLYSGVVGEHIITDTYNITLDKSVPNIRASIERGIYGYGLQSIMIKAQ